MPGRKEVKQLLPSSVYPLVITVEVVTLTSFLSGTRSIAYSPSEEIESREVRTMD